MSEWFKGKRVEETDFSDGSFDADGRKFVPSGSGGASAAEDVTVADAGGYFTGTNVEDVLQEVGADVGSIPTDYVAKAAYDANSILHAVSDNTPVALSVGASTILARLASGDLKAATPSELRTLLALVIGTNVQAYDADLTTWAGLTPSAFFQTLVDDSSAAVAQQTLGLFKAGWGMSSGCLAETVPYQLTAGSGAADNSQRIDLNPIWLPSGITLTSITFCSVSALSGLTNQLFGLYDDENGSSSGTPYALLRGSADDGSTAWGANTLKTLNLTSTYQTTRSGLFYLGKLVNATGIGSHLIANNIPAMFRILGLAGFIGNSSVTALPNPATNTGTYRAYVHWARVN